MKGQGAILSASAYALPPPAALRLVVDDEMLASNWHSLDKLSGSAAAGAAVKADGYGLGAVRVVPVLVEAGCRHFFVAHWSEAAALLPLCDPAGISVLHGPATLEEARYASSLGVKPVINSPRQARLWLEAGGGPCDVMLDTGMNRLGVAESDLGDEAMQRLSQSMQIDVLMTHLASADENCAQNEAQLQRFFHLRAGLSHRRESIANSAGIMLGTDYHRHLTRPGIALYGGVPRIELQHHLGKVARIEAVLLQTRKLQPGETIGYNATFVAKQTMRVGVVALGYADGYLTSWSGRGTALWRGKILPVIGRVSMDLTVIDLDSAPEISEGDWVEVPYNLPAAAKATELTQYELLTVLGRRFAR